MTLIAGVLCPDGFVIAGDTEVTYGDTLKVHADKLFDAEECPYRLAIGGAGHGDYIDQVRGDFMRAVAELKDPTIDAVRETLKDEIAALYEETIFPQYGTNDPQRPSVALIVGFIAPTGERCVWKTHELSVSDVTHFAFVGSGWTVAHHVAKKLLCEGQPVAVVHHLVYQILLEAQYHSPGVGGDIVTWAYKTGLFASRPYFKTGVEKADGSRKGYLWNLEGLLTSAIRDALSDNAERLEPKKQLICDLLDQLLENARNPVQSKGHVFKMIFPGHQGIDPIRDDPKFYR